MTPIYYVTPEGERVNIRAMSTQQCRETLLQIKFELCQMTVTFLGFSGEPPKSKNLEKASRNHRRARLKKWRRNFEDELHRRTGYGAIVLMQDSVR